MKLWSFLTASLLVALGSCSDTPATPDESEAPHLSAGQSAETPAPSVRVTVNPFSAVIQVGSSMLFTTVTRSSSGPRVSEAVSWSVSDSTIAAVSADGVVSGLLPGDVTLTAACRGGFATVSVSVQEPNIPVVVDELGWTFALNGQGLAPLYDVWGSSATDVFAVGSSLLWDCCGTIIHFDGTGWSYMALPEDVLELHGVWGSSPEDVFAVGAGGVVLHYDGMKWTRMQTPASVSLEAVWGRSATDVYAVGYGGIILHYDGSTWEAQRGFTVGSEKWLTDIWGTPEGNLFAVGSEVLRSGGSGWTRMSTPPVDMLLGVWGSSSRDVFAVGVGGVIIHYDGVIWSQMTAPARDGDLLGVWGNSHEDVFAVGDRKRWGPVGCCSDVLHFDGTGWRVLKGMTGQSLFDVWTTPERAFVVGSGPTVVHGLNR